MVFFHLERRLMKGKTGGRKVELSWPEETGISRKKKGGGVNLGDQNPQARQTLVSQER